ncbi:uncharacterized protein LOC133983942 [Scomber scombrus]|uniref:uncharacterized protein LOC133983942 n=1 Tax=Scomber scombrus TaxID=13677 RepID=UPI002DD9B61D|nr:uncharacterized protein LOC133983942 [Scomber scombrus]
MQETVELMLQTYSWKCVEVTKKVLKEINRTDLVQRLPDISSRTKKKLSVDEHLSALIHKVATKTAVRELLLETLNYLSDQELNKFKWLLPFTHFKKGRPSIPRIELELADKTKVVDLMMERCGQQSVEVIREVFMDIKRTDLVQSLPETSSGPNEKQSVDEQWPALIQKVETMTSVIKLLLETLADLSDGEQQHFKQVLQIQSFVYEPYTEIPWSMADMQDIVFLMVKTFGQQSLVKTKDILIQINRRDLVQRLSASSSGPKKKLSVDEHLSALIHKVATMGAVRELLLETLNDRSYQEIKKLKWLLQFTYFKKGRPSIPWIELKPADKTKVVELMMKTCGQRSVEVIREVFMDMKRTDLVQSLPETSSGPKAAGSTVEAFGVKTTEGEKQSVDEQWPALIQKVETMTSVIELLLETLADLSYKELDNFKCVLPDHLSFTSRDFDNRWRRLMVTDMQDIVLIMVQMDGQEFIEVTKKVFKEMKRPDLVQRLSDSSLRPKKKHFMDEQLSTVIQKVATMAAFKEMLLETLNDLSYQEFEKFKEVLELTVSQEDLQDISVRFRSRAEIVYLMLQNYGQHSVELMKKIFKKIYRSDLVQRLDTSSGNKEKQKSSLSQKDIKMTPVKEKLLETLGELRSGDLEEFKLFLQHLQIKDLPRIPSVRIERTDSTVDLVDLMVEICGQQSVDVTREVLKDMDRMDLVQSLSDTSSPSKGPSRSLESGAHGGIMDSSDWTKLEPEVNSTDADDAPTYNLQSEAGKFECSVSDLRWVSEEKVSFKYQFCSWEGHMERMESLQYMPAGPLMDITVTAGKLKEVYLPHWICTDDNPEILDKFAVLHIDDCGDVVEDASEVTSSHVKLSEPIFSPRAVLMKLGFPVKINCKVLIYCEPNITSLRLHVYLIPKDPALEKTMNKKKSSKGYKFIEKPRPDKYLKMEQEFVLKADIDTAKISPEKVTLRHDSQDPNFYEVYIKNPDRDFNLTLSHSCTNKCKPECKPVWTCEIQEDNYKQSGNSEDVGATGGNTLEEEEHTEDELSALVQKTATITTVKEKLFRMLQRLTEDDFRVFKWFLENKIPKSKLESANRTRVVDLMEQTYNQQAVEVTKMLFEKMNRNDLVKLL